MKEGLLWEDGNLIYYVNGEPKHAGVIKLNDAIYYIGSNGYAARGERFVHRSMTNGLLKQGIYTFDENCKLIEGSYVDYEPDMEEMHPNTMQSVKRAKDEKPKLKFRNILLAICLLGALIVGVVVFESKQENFISSTPKPTATGTLQPEITVVPTHIPTETPTAKPTPTPTTVPTATPTPTPARVELPVYAEDVLLVSSEAKETYDHKLSIKDAVAFGSPYRPFIFEYNLSGSIGVMLLSENAYFKNSEAYVMYVEKQALEINNLKSGTDYYYKVLVGDKEYNGSFHTAPSTRFVSIPGVYNTRDIGGYVTLDGKKVKQGTLIRGTEADGLVNPEYKLHPDACDAVRNTFGFVYDMDLRESLLAEESYDSPFGADIKHRFYHAPQYDQIFEPEWKDSLKQIFSDLADQDHYPMYLHCTWGQDRTGTIVFLLQGILNVPLEDMLYEYHLTGFTNPLYADVDYMDTVISGLNSYEGATIQEKIHNFLTTFVGVEDREIEVIRHIFLSE